MTAIGTLVAAAAIVLPLTFESGNVFVSAQVADTPLRLIVDTGGKGGLQLKAAVAGNVGVEIKPYVARFDYAAATLTLYSGGDRDEMTKNCNGPEVPLLKHPLGFWSSEMTTDHGRFRLIWDSGATYSLISAEVARARRLPLEDDLYPDQYPDNWSDGFRAA